MSITTNVLRNLREEHKRTQGYMAARLGVSQSQYNKIEKGDKEMEVSMLCAIAKIFEMDPTLLFQVLYGKTKSNTQAPYTSPGNSPADQEHNYEYYKKMAIYFEDKFLETYRLYIETTCKQQ